MRGQYFLVAAFRLKMHSICVATSDSSSKSSRIQSGSLGSNGSGNRFSICNVPCPKRPVENKFQNKMLISAHIRAPPPIMHLDRGLPKWRQINFESIFACMERERASEKLFRAIPLNATLWDREREGQLRPWYCRCALSVVYFNLPRPRPTALCTGK